MTSTSPKKIGNWAKFLPDTPGSEDAVRRFNEACGGTENRFYLNPQTIALKLLAEQESIEYMTWIRENFKQGEPQMGGPETERFIEDAHVIWRNMEGRQTPYNVPGKRNFSIVLTLELAAELEREGWEPKYKLPKEEGDEPLIHLPIKVNFESKVPPKVVMITAKNRTPLDKDTVKIFDRVVITYCDIMLNQYPWEVNGKSGVTAYLKTIFFKIYEDPIDLKYAQEDQED